MHKKYAASVIMAQVCLLGANLRHAKVSQYYSITTYMYLQSYGIFR